MTAPKSKLLEQFKSIINAGSPPAFFLNKQFDIYKFAQSLFQQIEDKRSSVTAITREQANSLGKSNLQFSNVKHESRLNAFYRLIGLPSEENFDSENISLLDPNGNQIKDKAALQKVLLQREFEQLQLTFKTFLQSNSVADLNKQIDSFQATEQQLIAELFDPNKLQNHTTRLFPILQYSQIQNVVEARNKIAPSFASTEERYVGEILTQPPFLESVITIRLLQQSGGSKINTQGAVEDVIIQSLAYALAELAKQYQRNQVEAEKHLLDGIALIRPKPPGVNSAAVKAADINANNRENDGIVTEGDIRDTYTQNQLNLYSAIASLLPTENDVIPIGLDINGTPFQSRNIKDNALTASFLNIINSNVDALQRAAKNDKKILQKRQLTQDKLTAEIGSIIGEIGGISLAEIVIVISALFVMDEEDLVGLISKSRFGQLTAADNNNTSAASTTISDQNQPNDPQKQINIFEILKQFNNNSTPRTPTNTALQILQNIVKDIYDAFVVQLSKAHVLNQ